MDPFSIVSEDRCRCRRVKSDGSAAVYFAFGQDASGRIARMARETDLAVYYSYDAIDRLLSETWRKASDSTRIYGFFYSYDPANNRLPRSILL